MIARRHLELSADLAAPRHARSAVRRLLSGRPPAVVDTVALVVSELVTNAVRHGADSPGATVAVHLEMTAERLRIEVADPGDGFDAEEAPAASDGFGLQIVTGLAEGWGVDPGPPHLVWCEMTV